MSKFSLTGFFKRLSLPAKLFLLVLVPMALLVYLTADIYTEKTEKVDLYQSYVSGISESATISSLINALQRERRHSYAFAMKKDSVSRKAIDLQRPLTDSALRNLENYKDPLLKDFRSYTFLDRLGSIRHSVDNGTTPDQVMHYYTTAIFRLKTIGQADAGNNKFLDPVYSDLSSGRILNEMSTYLGIIRANFYNAMYNKQNNIPMLYGLRGSYDVYKSYEKEFLSKASPQLLQQYKAIKEEIELRSTMDYIDTIFSRFSFDSLYNAEDWWIISGIATDKLQALQTKTMEDVKSRIDHLYKHEVKSRSWKLVFLIVVLALAFVVMAYTTRVITNMLSTLNRSAQRIAVGDEGIPVSNLPHDVIGSLSRSIARIDENNKMLTQAAESIGRGEFNIPIHTRGEKDALGNAILAMQRNLQQFTKDIEASKEQFRQIANTAPVMIWMTDEKGNRIFVNEGLIRFASPDGEPVLGNEWEAGIYPEDLQKYKMVFDEAIANETEFYIEYRLKRYDGIFRWLSEKGSPRYSGTGVFEGFIGTCMDINDIKEHERRKDDFIIIASHELKTPITSIKGYVQLLISMFRDFEKTRVLPSETSVRSSLTTIEKQVNKLTRLLAELLDLSRIETGKLELEKTVFNLNELVAETIEEVQFTAPNHHITYSNGVSYNVLADRDRIGQVILNLLTNAVKYSPDSTDVDVSIYHSGSQKVTVSVKDQGIGIDRKEQGRIFERFYRVEGKNEQTYPGFGIGLFIASEIVNRHDGDLTVKSEAGKGAEFSFSLSIAN